MFYRSLNEFKAAEGHEVDGLWLPRVTSILSIKAKPALYAYYAALPDFKTGEEIKNKSAEEGTLVHDTIERILKNEPGTVPAAIQPSIDAFMRFLNRNAVTPLAIEERVVSNEHRYVGTVDLLAEVNGTVGVVDIKTSKGIYRDYGMQTAAYTQAILEDTSLPRPEVNWILRIDQSHPCSKCNAQLRTKGGHQKVSRENNSCDHVWNSSQGEYEFRQINHQNANFKAFLAAKALWEWEHDQWLRQIL